MASDICIEAISLTKKYNARTLFSNLSFTLESGSCLAITGANGSGKSTLLKMAAGVVRPSSGILQLKAGGLSLDEEQRIPYIGMVSPEMQMYDSLTGYENIVFLAGARGIKLSMEESVRLCDRVGLGRKGAELVKTYSTGMKQRLKFGLLLGADARMWLLDEPSTNLDREGKASILEIISQSLAEGRCIMLATNDEAEAAYAQNTIVLS